MYNVTFFYTWPVSDTRPFSHPKLRPSIVCLFYGFLVACVWLNGHPTACNVCNLWMRQKVDRRRTPKRMFFMLFPTRRMCHKFKNRQHNLMHLQTVFRSALSLYPLSAIKHIKCKRKTKRIRFALTFLRGKNVARALTLPVARCLFEYKANHHHHTVWLNATCSRYVYTRSVISHNIYGLNEYMCFNIRWVSRAPFAI